MMKKLLGLLLIGLLSWPALGEAALAVDAHGKGTVVFTSPQTQSVTLASGVTQLFVAVVYPVSSITSVTWNGSENLSKLSTLNSSGFRHDVWALKSPSSGTHNIVVTYSANPGSGANVYWLSMTGGDTTTGWRTVYTRTESSGTGPGLTVVDSASGDIVIHAAMVFASTITFDGGETAQQTNNIGGGGFSGGLSYKSASGASTVVGATDVATYNETGIAAMPAPTSQPSSSSFIVVIP